MNIKKKSILLFSFIAVLVSITLFLFLYLLAQFENDASIINIAGQQRMLSQKIAKLCMRLNNNSDIIENQETIEELKKTYTLFETSHRKIFSDEKIKSLKLCKADTLVALFSDLQTCFDNIVISAKKIAQGEKNIHDALQYISEHENQYLSSMNNIVSQYVNENRKKIITLKFVMIFLCISILLLLFFEVKFIVIPTINNEIKNFKIIKEKSLKIGKQSVKLRHIDEELRQNNEELVTLNENIANQQEQLIELNKEHKRYFIAIEQSPVTMTFTDIYGRIEYTNPQYTKLTGYTLEEVRGKKPSILQSGKTHPEVYKDLWDTLLAGKVWTGEFINKTKGGKEFIERAIISPIKDNSGKTISYVAVKEDITKLKKAEQEIIESKEAIEEAHKNITDSINYARTIQEALLTNNEIISSLFKDYFLFFKPKEIVSGDFYYVNKVNEYIIFAIADCTGHGVPGGFLTMLGITFLHEIVYHYETNNPGTALNLLRARIKSTFMAFSSQQNNGLDIALCAIDVSTNILQFAGAFNPLWIIRNNELIEYKATRNPIGFYPKEVDFENHEIELCDNDKLYLFSDGYQDQFGGDKNKKFTKRRLKALLLEIHQLPMIEQKNIINDKLQKWKRDYEQVDDITVMAIKWTV